MSKTVGARLHFGFGLTRVVGLHLHHLAARSGTHFHCKTVRFFHYCLRNRRGKRTHQNRCCSDPVNEFAVAEWHGKRILPELRGCEKGPLRALLI